MSIQSIPIFPSLVNAISCESYEEYKLELVDWIYQYKSKFSIGVKKSNQNGAYQSADNFYSEDGFVEYLDKVYYELDKFRELFNIKSFKLINAWININPPGSFNMTHTHPNSKISGVWWIQIPENGGDLIFESPTAHEQHELIDAYKDKVKLSTNMYQNFYLTPREGSIVLFPSDLRHCVSVNESKKDRISIAFNLDIIR